MKEKLLNSAGVVDTGGEMSLQLSLQMALQSFGHSAPAFATRQVLLIHSSLRTVDRFDIFSTIDERKEKKVGSTGVVARCCPLWCVKAFHAPVSCRSSAALSASWVRCTLPCKWRV